PDARRRSEQRVSGSRPLATCSLVVTEPPELRDQGVGEEDVATATPLGDLGTDAHPRAWRPLRREHVGDIEPDDLGEPEAGAEGQAVDHVVAGAPGGCREDGRLLGCGQGRRAGGAWHKGPSTGTEVKAVRLP